MTNDIKHGDFTYLAENYALHRPAYSKTIRDILVSIVDKDNINFADIGAGTGIWTRMVADHKNVNQIIAVEPNDNMRTQGQNDKENGNINWRVGSGENTNLDSNTFDMVSMASSFHWVDFEQGMAEFARILKSGGRFVALWNPRYIKDNPILVDIEDKLYQLAPNMKRVSSGKSTFVEELTEKLITHHNFEDLIYLEGRHSVNITKAQYIGVWRSVNDIQYQLGDKFSEFMDYIDEKLGDDEHITSTYLTRAWSVRKK